MSRRNYKRLSLGDMQDKHPDEAGQYNKIDKSNSWIWLYAGLLLFFGALITILYRIKVAAIVFDCGSSVLDAQAKSCKFEPMQRAWIPQQCYFPEPADEYDPFNDRVWFLDANLTTRADPKSLEAGDVPVAYVADFHQEHCTYNWRKLAIAVDRKLQWIDDRVGNIHHANHCALGLASQTRNMSSCEPQKAGTFTRSNLNFLKCQKLI